MAVIETRGEWFAESIEAGGYEACVATQFLVHTIRLDDCRAQEIAIREHEMLRAQLVWDNDRELEAALLGDKLPKKPQYYARKLRESHHGCIYLAERLGDAPESSGGQGRVDRCPGIERPGPARSAP